MRHGTGHIDKNPSIKLEKLLCFDITKNLANKIAREKKKKWERDLFRLKFLATLMPYFFLRNKV